MLRRPLLAAGSLLLAAALILVGAGPAAAAQAGWADWDPLAGTSRDFTTTMRQQPAGFPEASVVTDSVAGSAVGIQTGASTFLAPQTAPGEKYGSSQGRPYLNLRPNGLNAAPPSTTTYTFERPTPAAGWTFVLGDIDADAVTVTATGADGSELTAAELGFRSTFNYCAAGVSPKPSCSGPGNDGTDLPAWDAATSTLTGGGADTAGASGWFEPTVPIKTLTLEFARTSGSPVYQTWFSALAYDIAGTVTAPEGRQQGITLQLLDSDGQELAEAETDADGRYSFPGYATYDDYRVEIIPPADLVAEGPTARDADLSAGDQTGLDFVLVEPVEVTGSISGTVSTDDGDPVPGAKITGTGPEGVEQTATTDDDGGYVLDELPPGDYAVVVTPPDGYQPVGPVDADVTVDEEGTAVTEVDFTLTRSEEPAYDVSGTVADLASGDPIAELEVELTGPDLAEPVVVTTDQDGAFAFPNVPPGADYKVTVDLPDGSPAGDPSATFEVVDRDVTGIDFLVVLGQPSPSPTPSAPEPTPSEPTTPPSEPTPAPTEPAPTEPAPTEPAPTEPTAPPTVVQPTEAPAPNDELPQTGAPSPLLAVAGLAALLLGTHLLRRRNR
ncbi:MSCRAMM family protein [Microlunatus speluncae]|uniref:MSCRAMM family protein n=1 Tax=Microlunatus speluncae TaxID=2594267 RepID=UPI00126673B6|nr:carboxypeptidase-like regulatory domain-containing protein [Microlunatus speluncae]